jgi:predicted DNA-binding protein with PD1-like motif
MNYVRDGSTIVARLFKGEEFTECVTSLCRKEHFSSGRVQAIGAVKKAVLGYFDTEEKKYIHFECKGELVSCMGNIARKGDDIIVHAHAVIADREGNCTGGHIVAAEPSVTVEVIITVALDLKRARDPDTELVLLDL